MPASEGKAQRQRPRLAIDAFPGKGFAVVDGGHFEDLPAAFRRARLFARSLFLEHGDPEIEKAGPWLVKLDQEPEATDKVFDIVGDKPAAVFWSCEAGEAVLHRHLRTINMARIPAWAAAGQDKPPPSTVGEPYTPVFFRHFDPRVLGALLPCLDAGQFARFLGPAEEVAFSSKDFGFKRLLADTSGPAAAPGMLTIRPQQIEAMADRRVSSLHRRTLLYLRDVAPEATREVPDNHLLPFIENCHDDGARLGLTTQHAHFQWAYLNVMSNGRISNVRAATDFISAGPGRPDDRIQLLVGNIVSQLRTLGEQRAR